MKLIKLVLFILRVILNIVYYIVVAPVALPLTIYRYYKNKNWRKNIKVGDECFFVNILGKRSYGKVEYISVDRKQAGIERASSFGWHEIDDLRIV